ncbi:type II and III secretion system protein, partial [bacterium]|nr:type II and III secretion system protein [bacterium]
LQVGDQVPVATQSAVGVTDPDSPIVNTIQFRDTGVILEVTPRVNDSGLVIMEISQEVSDVIETETSGIDSPTIQQRRLQSTVAVKDGQTIALGGLIRDDKEEVRSGVPFVQDLPVIGSLFRSTVTNSDRTELLVLLTPRVARDPEDAKQITDEIRRRIEAVRSLGHRVR